MKKISYLSLALFVCAAALTACHPPVVPVDEAHTVSSATLIAAVSDFYDTWEEERNIPATVKVGTKELSISEFIYAEAAALVNISTGSSEDITYKSFKAASNPDRDSYDRSEIAVTGGTPDGKGVAEDIVTIARRLIETSTEKEQIPNQILVYRGDDALAFSANRAIITIARTIALYAGNGRLPATVATDYLSASATLRAFAEQFVGYLDVWENTIADILSADGSHCEDNGTPWERVHFIPIPQDTKNDWVKQGAQYDPKYLPYKMIEIDGTTYTAAQCWEIAIRGLMDMCTTTGQDFLNTMARNSEIPFGNGKSLSSAPISKPSDACVWGKYPWYESTNDGGPVKYMGNELKEASLAFIMKCTSWHVTRSFISNQHNTPLGMIGNFQLFGTASSTLNLEGYEGLICPMREFLILARFYKYMLDNNINKNVYDALKDVKVDFELYKQELPVVVEFKELNFEASDATALEIGITASENWTATPAESWIHVTPASGASGNFKLTVTVDDNTAEEVRYGSISIAAGNYSKVVPVMQEAYVKPTSGTLMEFAQAFVTCLDVWEKTVGTVDAEGTHNGATAWKNVHLLPIVNPNAGYTNLSNQYDAMYAPFWTATVGETEYTSNQCWEIAIRGLMNLCTAEGEAFLTDMTDRNKPYTLANGVNMYAPVPTFSSINTWGAYPWYETDETQLTFQGEAVKEVGIDLLLKCGSWHVVRSFIKNSGNNPLNRIGNYQEFGTESNTLILDGYKGFICPMRELLIAARIYKYILDNNITENVYDAIKGVKFDYDLYGTRLVTIMDFATAYVGLLTTWQNTVGNVTIHKSGDEETVYENVHYIPMETVVKVGGKDYNVSQALEIAMRSFMLLVGVDGNNTTSKGAGNFEAVTPARMTDVMPADHDYGYNWWYLETVGNGGPIRYKGEPNKVTWDMLKNYSERNINFPGGNNNKWSNVSGYDNGRYTADYTGCFVSGRCQMAFLNMFKMLLDDKVNENVATYLEGKSIDCTLWGVAQYD